MLERATSETFTPLIGDRFRVTPGSGDPVDLVLDECTDTRYGSPDERGGAGGRTPFSLLFHAPDGRLFEQQTCTVEHATLGEFPLFLVPIGPGGGGMRYEAVFA